jgi:HSP20 family protein
MTIDTTEKQESTDVVRSEPAPRRLFDWLAWPAFAERIESLGFFDEHFMRTEEVERDGVYVIRAEMPGLDPDRDVDVRVTDNVLHIEATRSEEKQEDRGKGRFRSEFRYGHYVRDLVLPVGVRRDDVKAMYKDGILEIQMPLDTEHASPTKVAVQHA